MAYVISDDCVMCGACESGCPVGAPQEAYEAFSLHCFSADGASKEADHYKS